LGSDQIDARSLNVFFLAESQSDSGALPIPKAINA
jgi:hypothetical protein